jgi:hypothetical protein
MNEEILARCEKRLTAIRESKDEGVYAKFYVQDVNELIEIINELNLTIDRDIRTINNLLNDNIE